MKTARSLAPARFLVFTAHLVFFITLFWSVDQLVRTCLPISFTAAEYNSVRTELLVALSLTVFTFAIEFFGFAAGFSMFNGAQTLFSIAAHAGATIALSFYVFDSFYCRLYWYIFAFCNALPAFTELLAIISVVWLKKNIL